MMIPLAPFPSKGSPVENQAGLLARGTRLLSAPSQGLIPQWSPQISFRSQLRGSKGFTPSSLLTAPCCKATWLSSTSKLFPYSRANPGTLSSLCRAAFRSRARAGRGSRLVAPWVCAPLAATRRGIFRAVRTTGAAAFNGTLYGRAPIGNKYAIGTTHGNKRHDAS
jgi:hypothetical protein